MFKTSFPFSIDRTSIANSFTGSLAWIGTMGDLDGSGDFFLMHLSQLAVPIHIFFFIRPTESQANEIKSLISAKMTKFIVETL